MKRWYRLGAVFLFAVLITACAEKTENRETSVSSAGEVSGFPVTVELGDVQVTVESQPQRIVAISLDTADAVLELTDSANVIAAADSIENGRLAFQVEKGSKVAHKLRFSDSQDPEKILSFDPDLILLTKQHEGEMDAEKILMQSGIPLVSFQPWNTLDDIGENVLAIGKLIGEERKAEALVEAMQAKVRNVRQAVADMDSRRSVLVISPVGTNTGPFILGSDSLAAELLRAAGTVPAVEQIGLDKTLPASVEQVIKMDPDYIVLTDWDGEGERVFTELMDTPGWNTLQAVQNDRVKLIDAKYVITSNIHVAEGIKEIARWVYPERFEGAGS